MASKYVSMFSALVFCLVCSTCTARDALYSGQRLTTGQSLVQGRYVLTMQADCNLVLYAAAPVWASGTFGRGVNCYAALLPNGNFVVYSGAGTALWSSRTIFGAGNYILILQPDRNLVVYGTARWSTRTNIATAGFSQIAINATKVAEGQHEKP